MDIKRIVAKGLKYVLQPPAITNCTLHENTDVSPGTQLNNVVLGRYSYIGYDCFAVNAHIGMFCSIADSCRIGGAEHPISRVSTSPVFHEGNNCLKKNFSKLSITDAKEVLIGNDVWIGASSIVKSGITIGNGAVIGMGSVVTHDVGPYEIWAGVPARCIRKRFSASIIERLEKSKWWDFDDEKLELMSNYMENPETFIGKMKELL